MECYHFWPFRNLLGRFGSFFSAVEFSIYWCLWWLSGGIYSLRLTFCDRYPEKPPKVRFTTKMFHPNVYADGNICLDIIAAKWSPSYTVSSILTSIQSLLTDPNVQSPANPVRDGRCMFFFCCLNLFFRKLLSYLSKTKNRMRGGCGELQKNRSHRLDGYFFSSLLIRRSSSTQPIVCFYWPFTWREHLNNERWICGKAC